MLSERATLNNPTRQCGDRTDRNKKKRAGGTRSLPKDTKHIVIFRVIYSPYIISCFAPIAESIQ